MANDVGRLLDHLKRGADAVPVVVPVAALKRLHSPVSATVVETPEIAIRLLQFLPSTLRKLALLFKELDKEGELFEEMIDLICAFPGHGDESRWNAWMFQRDHILKKLDKQPVSKEQGLQ